jgi:alcohol dehydrogenase class IV
MQKEIIGHGSFSQIKKILDSHRPKKILCFRGKKSFEFFKDIFAKAVNGFAVDYYSVIDSNPQELEIKATLQEFKSNNYDLIIAFGGGSIIDFAKAYRFYSDKNKLFIAIPTTAGTGSESTQFAVVYVDGKKTSLDDVSIMPNYAIIDSQFIENSPSYLKACAAIDAYCQAIESFWSVLSNEESREYAKQAIILIHNNIEKAVLSDEKSALEKMAQGAHLAGKAINISRTTAAHALSYEITIKYKIPHGHAVALSMADLFTVNGLVDGKSCQDKRGIDYVKNTMAALQSLLNLEHNNFASYWHNLMDKIGLEWRFSELGISDKENLIACVNHQRLANNPKNILSDLPNFWNE